MKYLYILVITVFLMACNEENEDIHTTSNGVDAESTITEIANDYVKVIFQIGEHDPNYVDAYFGPDSLKNEALSKKLELKDITTKAKSLIEKLDNLKFDWQKVELKNRVKYLKRMLESAIARVRYLNGERMSFDEESKALYDAVSPSYSEEHYAKLIEKLEDLLPGEGDVATRFNEFRNKYIIPQEKVAAVFEAAIAEGKRRTEEYLQLPEGESFKVEYVNDKPWGGYNWFKGNAYSLIQVNMDLPIYVDRAVDLACHEGYPGHHAYHSLIEKHMLIEKGMVEFSIYPLFSPQALISEGTANFGIKTAFPGDDRIKFEKEVVFPLAGFDPEEADKYYEIMELAGKLTYAGNDAARNYLDGSMTREEAIAFKMKYQLQSELRATKLMDFIDTYRSYVINYNLGHDMVEEYINKLGGTADKPEKRWQLFKELLSMPVLPSDLIVK